MGCGGSKTAAKASAPAANETTEADFKINIENPTGDADLGLVVQYPEKKYILVESIKEDGLIPAWNKASENTPEMQVKAGDFIVVINGKFGDSDAMMGECKATSITLGVKRAPQAAAPAAEAPAAEAPVTAPPSAEAPAAEAPADAPPAEAPSADAPAEAQAAEAPAVEASATAPVAEAPAAEAPAADVPAAEESAAEATAAPAAEPDFCLQDASVSVEPEPTEVGAGASESRMCNWC